MEGCDEEIQTLPNIVMKRSNVEFIPSTSMSILQIKIKLSFKFKSFNWIRRRGSALVEFSGQNLSQDETTAAAVADFVGYLTSYRVREAVQSAIGCRLSDDHRAKAVTNIMEEVEIIFQIRPQPKHGVLDIQFKIRVVHTNVSVVETDDDDDDMVEECTKLGGSSCSICLEDYLGGGGGGGGDIKALLKTACLHVFHGGCIGEWVGRSNHHCPICRCKIPMFSVPEFR